MAWILQGTVNPPWYVNVEFDGEKPGTGRSLGLAEGKRSELAELAWPKSGYTEKKRKKIPAYIDRWSIQMVSESFRQLVEDMEPGVHQFFPFDLRNGKRGEPAPEQYYILNIATLLDSVDPEKSDVKRRRGVAGKPGTFVVSGLSDKFVVRSDVIAGHHLWRERYVGSVFFGSEEFINRFNALKLKQLEKIHCLED